MHALLENAAASLTVDLPNLAAAADRTAARVATARAAVEDFLSQELGEDRSANEPVVAAFGSMARAEMAPGSDFDYLVILNRVEQDPGRIQIYRRAAIQAFIELALDPPGHSGLFGGAVSGADLVNTIGLDVDTNLHLSRRVLLLEESIALNATGAHEDLLESVSARYLHEHGAGEAAVPRFLLNDVIRYWRTVAVDYQAKRWDEIRGTKWGLRYVKLLTSRKLTYAAMVASLFWPVITNTPTTSALLRDQFCLPSLARLAQLTDAIGVETRPVLGEVLVRADEWNGRLADDGYRGQLESVEEPAKAPPDSAMYEARESAKALQQSLEALFFSDEPLPHAPHESLASLTKRYLSF